MLAKLLAMKKIKSAMSDDGKSALDLLCTDMDAYGLVFMDNLMPVMNGIEATKLLRERGFPHIIVGLTGNVMTEELNEFLDAGLSVVFSKPVRVQQIDMLIDFISKNGTLDRAGMYLREVDGIFVWTRYVNDA
jgi:CheY-like chemotaxis protein